MKVFGRLTVIEEGPTRHWRVKCECGTVKTVSKHDLFRGMTKSCGCLTREATIKRNKETATRGGLTHTPTGRSWSAMMSRCYNTKYHSYQQYGKVGIKACEFIAASPVNLLSLIGERSHKTSLDRINNDLGYYCGSCRECLSNSWPLNLRWATATQQTRNQRRCHVVEINGIVKCVAEWAEIVGINESSFRGRLNQGWSKERLLSPKTHYDK